MLHGVSSTQRLLPVVSSGEQPRRILEVGAQSWSSCCCWGQTPAQGPRWAQTLPWHLPNPQTLQAQGAQPQHCQQKQFPAIRGFKASSKNQEYRSVHAGFCWISWIAPSHSARFNQRTPWLSCCFLTGLCSRSLNNHTQFGMPWWDKGQ